MERRAGINEMENMTSVEDLYNQKGAPELDQWHWQNFGQTN